jgi:hypothetical protein
MTWASLAYGTPTIAFNAPMTPAIPGTPPVGSILLLQTGVQMGGVASPVISGWTNLSTVAGEGIQETTQVLYGRISTGSDAVTVNWNYSAIGFATINAYSGGSLNLSNTPSVNYNTAATAGIVYAAASVTNPNCLAVAFGTKNTALGSQPTWSPFGSFNLSNQAFYTGTLFSVYNDWIQTTATSIAGGGQFCSPADSGAEANVGRIVVLLPFIAPTTTPYFDSVEEWG